MYETEFWTKAKIFNQFADDGMAIHQVMKSVNRIQSFSVFDKGINGDDQSCVLVWEGIFYGMGYIPADAQIINLESLKDYLTTYKENSFIRNLVNGYAARFPAKVIFFEKNPVAP